MAKLLTAKEIGEILKLNPQTVTRWGRLNRIPMIWLGGRTYRFDLEAVQASLKARTGAAAGD